jgi:phage terminase large subunit-like protein
LALKSKEEINTILNGLTEEEAALLLYDWQSWARPDQLAPDGDWFAWLLRSGRGAGKTRTGAEWIISKAKNDNCPPIALIGETKADVRDTMIELGDSSIMKISPPWFMPKYEPSKRRLTWPNGSTATTFNGWSLKDADQLRGPQHGFVWIDELAKMRYPKEVWDNMELGLRLGDKPQVVVTTTPRPIPIIKMLQADDTCIETVVSTYSNFSNLSEQFIARIRSKYEGTPLAQQEIHGQIMDDDPNALWSRDLLEETRVSKPPAMYRIVVAIDPAATTGQTGIVVAGIAKDVNRTVHGYTLEDCTPPEGVKPDVWAFAAVSAYHKWQADLIIGEVNNGGDMIESVIRHVQGGQNVAYKTIRATKGKHPRAEPVSNLYHQGKAHQVGHFANLEDELCTWVPGNESPNRLDAMVWAYTELMLGGVKELSAGLNPLTNYRG